VKPIGVWAPNQNTVAERVVQSAKQECLSITLSSSARRHCDLSDYLLYHHQHRPHQGMRNRPVVSTELARADLDRPRGEVVCHERLAACCVTTNETRHKVPRR
jgi:hypothetical protein